MSEVTRLSNKEILERARHTGYLACDRKSVSINQLWWEECVQEKKPFVKLSVRYKMASLEIEMAPSERILSDEQQKTLVDLLWPLRKPKHYITVSETDVYDSDIEFKEAEMVMPRIMEVLQ